jgi:DNA polymerase III subunit gamma/tau
LSYQVLARKWRPQRFDDVIGQRGVTQTLRNAIAANRIHQSFVFAGPRGVGKTTTARILARGLNCIEGPTADPCGVCDACVEIAQGRDMDVIEIDAASHTGIDNVRDVIIDGLAVRPSRNRFKIFIVDEVHRLSKNAFDALLKSIEEPPPHAVFMMATTEIDKVPQTILSRSQVYELKLIGILQIADQLRRIAAAEGIAIDDAALMLITRAGDGSMRDAQSAFDQVIAFAGHTISADAVTTVLGLVRRDLLFDMAEAVAQEDAAALVGLAGHAVESGFELRSVVRELARLTRDVLVVKVDQARLNDPEIAAEGERDRLAALASQFSSEDLMRAFDVLTKAESDIRASAQPRYHLEMALLRWLHLRRLVPLSDLIQGIEKGSPVPGRTPAAPVRSSPPAASRPQAPPAAPRPVASPAASAAPSSAARPPARPSTAAASPSGDLQPVPPAQLKEAFLEEVRRVKKFFHGTVIAMAQRIDVDGDRIIFTFGPHHRALRGQLDQTRPWLEDMASTLAGRRMTVTSVEGVPVAAKEPGARASAPVDERKDALKQQALEDSGVQAMLDVFAAEIKDVEER